MIKVDEIVATARAETRLSVLDDPTILQGLEVYVQALNEEAQLTERGVQLTFRSLVAALSNRLRVDDYLARHSQLLEGPVEKPMFVFGLPRTGTTLAINLLNEDPARRCLLRWQALNPVPPVKAEAFMTDPRFLSEQARLELTVKHAPQIAAIHHEDADSPSECQYVMAQSFCAQLFEAQAAIPSYRDWWLQASYLPAFRYHKRFLQLLQSEAPGRWTLKNPWHALYLDDLTRVYPDAQLVMTHRDPVAVVGSFCSLIENVRVMFSDVVDRRRIGEDALDTFGEMIRRSEAYRQAHGRGAIYDLRYARLVADPVDEMRALYRHFDEPWTPVAESAMTAFLTQKPKGLHGEHRYRLETYGLSPEVVRERFEAYCQDFDLLQKS